MAEIFIKVTIYDLLHFTGQDFTAAQRERAQEDFKVLFKGAPPHPPPIRIRRTATAPGSPYSFRIVRGFFYVPQNYQHSRYSRTSDLSSISEKTRKSNHLQMKLQRQHLLLSYLKTLSVGPVGVSESRTHDLPRHSPVHNQVS